MLIVAVIGIVLGLLFVAVGGALWYFSKCDIGLGEKERMKSEEEPVFAGEPEEMWYLRRGRTELDILTAEIWLGRAKISVLCGLIVLTATAILLVIN